jgi:sec-independent protein translocase protein TatA
MNIGILEILVIGLVLALLFGKGRISGIMGDLGKGITSFKKGLQGEPKPADPPTSPPPAANTPPSALLPPPPGPKP